MTANDVQSKENEFTGNEEALFRYFLNNHHHKDNHLTTVAMVDQGEPSSHTRDVYMYDYKGICYFWFEYIYECLHTSSVSPHVDFELLFETMHMPTYIMFFTLVSLACCRGHCLKIKPIYSLKLFYISLLTPPCSIACLDPNGIGGSIKNMTIGRFHALRREIAYRYNIPVIDTVLGDVKYGSGASLTKEDENQRQAFIK